MPTVLIVDEQEHMRRLLRSKFEREGFRVLAAESVEAAVRAVRELEIEIGAGIGAEVGAGAGEGGAEGGAGPDERSVALIVLDERLHDSSGRPGADRLRAVAALADVPMILLTPRTSSGSTRPLDAVLQMPFRPSQLVALAREAL